MIQQEPEFLERESRSDLQPWTGYRRRGNTEAIRAALDYLVLRHQDRTWRATGGSLSDTSTTACVVARLKDVMSSHGNHRLRLEINESLDWLAETHTRDGGWKGASGEDEVGVTVWAILALTRHGRTVRETALEWIRRCRRQDGGFGDRPESTGAGRLEISALAVQALGHVDSQAERYLCAGLQVDAGAPEEQLAACAVILDCDKSLVPLPLLNQACQVTARVHAKRAHDQALLLRCLLRLRLTRAWPMAEALRAAQMENGSWPGEFGAGADSAVTTAAAAAALALVDSQPGLYFGSDSPQPRRLQGPLGR